MFVTHWYRLCDRILQDIDIYLCDVCVSKSLITGLLSWLTYLFCKKIPMCHFMKLFGDRKCTNEYS